jgi:hypothetical protein
MTIDQLDALVNAEIQKHEGGLEEEEVPVVMAETLDHHEEVDGVVKNEMMEEEEAKVESV